MAPNRYYSSNAVETSLTNPITNSATSVLVASTVGYPTSYPFTIQVELGTANEEIMEVTNVSGTTLTVVRGVDGSSALAHTMGAKVVHGVSARDFREPQEHLGNTLNVHGIGATGSVVGTDTAQTLTNKTLTAPTIADLSNAQHDHSSASKGGATLGTFASPVTVNSNGVNVYNGPSAVGYMKVTPGAFTPSLAWNAGPVNFTKQGGLSVESIALGNRAATHITTPSSSSGADPMITLTSGNAGTSDAGDIDLTADGITLSAGTVGLFATKRSWAPIWSAQSVAPSLGDANIDAKWWDLGPLAFFRLRIVFGSTTTFGSGLWSFSLPFTPIGINQVVSAIANTAAAARYTGTAIIQNTADAQINRITFAPGGTSGAQSNNPIVWAASDTLIVQGMVEKQ